MIKKYRFNSIQFIIAISCVIVSLVPMSYTGISIYTKFSNALIENSQITTEQTISQLKINIEDYLEQAIKITSDIFALIQKNHGELHAELFTELNLFYSTRNDIVAIRTVSTEGDLITAISAHQLKEKFNAKEEAWFNKINHNKSLYYISDPYVLNIYHDYHPWIVSVCKPITIVKDNKSIKSILVIDISIQTLNNLCRNLNLGGRGYVYITDQFDNILYHPQQALIFSGLKDEVQFKQIKKEPQPLKLNTNATGEEIIVIRKPLSFVDWNIIGVSYVDNIAHQNSKIVGEVMITLPIIILIIILLSWYISGEISLPILKLERYMRKVQQGDFDTNINLKSGEQEVLQLAKSFNIMVKKIKDLIHENQLEQEAKRKSELNALQAQINPHFLYNTLDSIMWMAEAGKNEEVVELVTALARFFRISINKGENIITVEEELEHARNYMLIQKIRYKDKFEFDIFMEDEVRFLKTINLVLQPLVENAIYHGIEYMVDEGYIHIRATRQEDFLLIEVIDNGLGMGEEQLARVFDEDNTTISKKKGNGVGVRNVNERIKLMFGEPYGLSIESEREEGTTVKLRLPIIGDDHHYASR